MFNVSFKFAPEDHVLIDGITVGHVHTCFVSGSGQKHYHVRVGPNYDTYPESALTIVTKPTTGS